MKLGPGLGLVVKHRLELHCDARIGHLNGFPVFHYEHILKSFQGASLSDSFVMREQLPPLPGKETNFQSRFHCMDCVLLSGRPSLLVGSLYHITILVHYNQFIVPAYFLTFIVTCFYNGVDYKIGNSFHSKRELRP